MDINTNFSISRFPDELISNDEKKSFEFGQKYASAIWQQWGNKMATRTILIEQLRKYARGEQDILDCQKNMTGDYTDLAYWEVDWNDKLNLLPILLRNFMNTVDMDQLQPIVKAIDPSAIEIKNKRKTDKMKLFYAKDFIKEAAQMNGGQSPIPLDQVPESKEQVDLEEQTAEPLKIEKAESLVLEAVARDNYFNLIQKEILEEMIVTNYGIGKVSTCPIKGMKMESIKIENFVHGTSSNKYFTDCAYYGEIKQITIGQFKNIAKESGLVFTPEEIIAMTLIPYNHINDDTQHIKVLFYSFKTFMDDSKVVKRVFSKKINQQTGALKLIDKSDYKPRSANEKPDMVIDNYDVWFEGIMVLNAERTIIRHRLMQNMAENKANGSIIPPYIVITPRHKSIVEEVRPRINAIQELRYRIIHFRNTLKGSITDLDPDMIASVAIGNDKLTPKEVLSMYFLKGIRFIKSRDEDNEPIQRSLNISESDTPIPRALIELSNQFITEVQLLNQTFGATQYDQASPDQKTLGEFEPYRFSNNSSMRDYTDCLYQWTIMNYQSVSSRINDAIQWKNVRDRFISAIGTDDIEVIEEFKKNRGNHFFGIYTDLVPTVQERADLQKRLEYYVTNGILSPLDEMRITNVRNRAQALSLLNLIVMAKQKEIAQQEQQKAQMTNDANSQSAIVAGQVKEKLLQLEYQLRMQEGNQKFQHEAFILQKDGEIKINVADVAANAKVTSAQFAAQFQADLAKFKTDANYKSRIDGIEKSKQLDSQLIDQRKGKNDGIYPQAQQPETDLSQLGQDMQVQPMNYQPLQMPQQQSIPDSVPTNNQPIQNAMPPDNQQMAQPDNQQVPQLQN